MDPLNFEEQRGRHCNVCYHAFSRDGEHVPRILTCGHTYCTACLGKLVGKFSRGKVCCPTCKADTSIPGLVNNVQGLAKNFAVLEILEGLEESLRGSSSATNQVLLCNEHENEPKKVYCLTDREVICIYCQVYGQHKGHECQLVSQVAASNREVLGQLQDDLSSQKSILLPALKHLQDISSSVQQQEEHIVREIRHHFEMLRRKLCRREKEVIGKLKALTSGKVLLLREQCRHIGGLLDRAEQLQSSCQTHISGPDYEIVQKMDLMKPILKMVMGAVQLDANIKVDPLCHLVVRDDGTATPLPRQRLQRPDVIIFDNVGDLDEIDPSVCRVRPLCPCHHSGRGRSNLYVHSERHGHRERGSSRTEEDIFHNVSDSSDSSSTVASPDFSDFSDVDLDLPLRSAWSNRDGWSSSTPNTTFAEPHQSGEIGGATAVRVSSREVVAEMDQGQGAEDGGEGAIGGQESSSSSSSSSDEQIPASPENLGSSANRGHANLPSDGHLQASQEPKCSVFNCSTRTSASVYARCKNCSRVFCQSCVSQSSSARRCYKRPRGHSFVFLSHGSRPNVSVALIIDIVIAITTIPDITTSTTSMVITVVTGITTNPHPATTTTRNGSSSITTTTTTTKMATWSTLLVIHAVKAVAAVGAGAIADLEVRRSGPTAGFREKSKENQLQWLRPYFKISSYE
ncbi:uncharacterized protein [Diadema antillarum]|uniref:uncharacterized protein n=1 Tax=Diadema antillarum TaxID=105358 RepID=UPI003A8728C5